MNSKEFELNYLRIQGLSVERTSDDIIRRYISKKFRWNQVKVNYFVERNKIVGMGRVLEYDKYPHW